VREDGPRARPEHDDAAAHRVIDRKYQGSSVDDHADATEAVVIQNFQTFPFWNLVEFRLGLG